MGWSAPHIVKRLVVCALFAVTSFTAGAANVAPEYIPPQTQPRLRSGGSAQDWDLRYAFFDPDVPGSAVRVSVRIGATIKTVDIALFDQQTPITVTNFLNYVVNGLHNSNIFHRSVPGFVLQGGGFQWKTSGIFPLDTFPAIQNEPVFSNVRGTVAMAKLGDNPNSATSQWFVNLADNSANLDYQNGGFTVFGRVIGNGMDVMDEIAALPRVNANGGNPNGPFDNLPVKNWTTGNILREHTIETISQVVPTLTFQAESSDPDLVAVSVNGPKLHVTPSATREGSVTITVYATDLEGAVTQDSFTVNVIIDITPPEISTPSPQTLVADASRFATMPDLRGTPVNVTDQFGVFSFIQSPAPGSRVLIGEHPLVFTAVDEAGNSKTVQSTVTVNYSAATLPVVSESGARFGAPVPVNGSAALATGSSLGSFGTPAISDDGSLAARVVVSAGRAKLGAIYVEDASQATRLAAVQGQSCGITGVLFKSFRDPLISSDGKIAFVATTTAKSSENDGVWSDAFGALSPVLREGLDLPGLAGLKLKSVTSLSFDDSALLATVKLARVSGLVTAANDTALIRVTSASSTTILAQTGTDLKGSKIKQISALQPVAKSPGQGRWTAEQGAVAKLTLLNGHTVISRLTGNGPIASLVESAVSNAGLDGTFKSLGLPTIGGSAVAMLGTRAKDLGVTGANDLAMLYASDGNTFQEVLRESAEYSGFASFSDPVANDQGQVVFFGVVRGSAPKLPKTSALWLTHGNSAPEMVAKIGAPAVGRDGEDIQDVSWSNIVSFALPNGAGAGPLFVAQLAGKGVKAQSKLGLWAVDSGNVLRMLLRTGEDLVLPSGTKRLTGFTLLNALPGSYGARRSYNSTGSVAVQATFDDRSTAILRINIP